jgi:type I restriction enzyme S subunit
MSKLSNMLETMCPHGVDFKKFGDIAQISRGASPRPIKNFITTDEDGVNWVKIGDVAVGSKYITETNEKITQEGAKKSRMVHEGDFILSNSMSFGRPYIMKINGCIHDGWLSISEFDEYMVPDFLYYVLVSSEIQNEMKKRASFGGAVQNLNADIVRELVLPVPPLEVQCEIVQILDKFTLLSAELSAELSARKKQYDYYGNQLFESTLDDVNVSTVGEIITSLKTGLNPRKNFTLNEAGACYTYITGKDIFDNQINVTERTDRITPEALELINKRAHLEKGLLLFASTGTGTVGRMAIIEEYNDDWGMSETLYGIKVDEKVILPHYLMFFLYSVAARKQFEPKITKGSVPHLKVKDLLDVKIPVPSIEVQTKIVDVLSWFDKLCNGMMEGLPAEIEARQKQYEYYRDKLLTFKEAV